MKTCAVGIDLGGTNIKGGLVHPDGSVILKKSIKTEASGGTEHVVGRIAQLVRDLMAEGGVGKDTVAAVCVGSPGPLDSRTGVVHETPNMGWRNVPLGDLLADKLGMRVFVENDANVAAFGEAWAGVARDSRCTIMLTLGTGIGGGIIMNGGLWRGVTDTGAELGHMTINFDGPLCGCGNRGCIEAYASATAVARRMKEAVQAGRASTLAVRIKAGEEADSEQIYNAAAAGDSLAREIFEQTGCYLGIAIANYINIFNPDCIVLHGGMVNAGDMLTAPLWKEVKKRSFEPSLKKLRIVPSALRGDAGIVGAAGIAFQRTGQGQGRDNP